MTEKTARAMWRFLRREGDDYVFAARIIGASPLGWAMRRVPVERFWGGAR